MPESTRGRADPVAAPDTWVSGAVSSPAIAADMRRILAKRPDISCNRPALPGVVRLWGGGAGGRDRAGPRGVRRVVPPPGRPAHRRHGRPAQPRVAALGGRG